MGKEKAVEKHYQTKTWTKKRSVSLCQIAMSWANWKIAIKVSLGRMDCFTKQLLWTRRLSCTYNVVDAICLWHIPFVCNSFWRALDCWSKEEKPIKTKPRKCPSFSKTMKRSKEGTSGRVFSALGGKFGNWEILYWEPLPSDQRKGLEAFLNYLEI